MQSLKHSGQLKSLGTAASLSCVWPQAMEAAAEALQATLQNVNIDATAASDAIKHLLNLQAVGLASIQQVDPVKMYIENQVSKMTWMSRHCFGSQPCW